ncbi:MAG: EFR1 family ferrodoxin [Solobacterium sp.]|nr:EFR1 family ferrodoxin [Solobacterium sp.]
MKTCYFTATGNSLYTARRIGGELLSIPQLMKQDRIVISDEAVGIVCPVYGGEMPRMVRQFIEKAVFKTNYFFFVYTYGASQSFAKLNAIDLISSKGIRLSYVNAVLMVDNFLPGFESQHQIDTAPDKNIEEQLESIARDIAERKQQTVTSNLLNRTGKRLVHATMAKIVMNPKAAQKYIVNENCVRCGICAKVCPANNITVTDAVHFSDHCEVCYACVHNCPKNAIHLKSERSAVRFRNEHVSLKEIIDSNM